MFLTVFKQSYHSFIHSSFSRISYITLGLVSKNVEGEFCLIHHLSYPRGSSLSDEISTDYTTVSYARVENALA